MRPRHDPVPKVPAGLQTARRMVEKAFLAEILRRAGRRRPGDADGGEPCPVEPNRPLDLSGGAAAALDFD